MKLFLDDTRVPADIGLINEEWCIVRNYAQFCAIVDAMVPDEISFDHDLHDFSGENGAELDGLSCAKYLVLKDKKWNYLHDNFKFNVHSANPIGAKRIQNFLDDQIKFKRGEI